MKELQTEINEFKRYIVNNRGYIFIASSLLLLVYGAWLFNNNPRIDTEPVINYPNIVYNGWLNGGRQGLVLTEYVFGLRWFNPYISTSIGYLVICVAGVLLGYVFWRCSRDVFSGVYASFGLLFFCSPVFVEQFYFDIQIFQIAWALVLSALGAGFSYYGIIRKSIIMKLLAVICIVWELCSYPIFMVVHVVIVAFCYIILCFRWGQNNTEANQKDKCVKLLIGQICLFLCAVIINTIITRMFFSGGTYLESQILWGKESFEYCIRCVLGHIYRGFIGKGVFHTGYYGIVAITTLIYSFVYFIKKKEVETRWLCFIAILFLQISPFLLTIYMGNVPAARSQFIYPLVLASDLVLLITLCRKNWLSKLFILIAICAIWSQCKVSMRLIYTEDICAQEDARLATAIEQRINEVTIEQKPIAFVGKYNNKLNGACLRGELIGMSIFACNYEVLPHYWVSSNRACTLLETVGYEFENVTEVQMLRARALALKMPEWPENGSVVDAGDFIIVKLSEDEWPEELEQKKGTGQ